MILDLATRLDKNLKVQVRHITTDKLTLEGYVSDLNKDLNYHGSTCVPDFIKPSHEYSEEIGNIDFEIYFHYHNEYPQTILCKKTVERLFPWGHTGTVDGAVTGYSSLTNELSEECGCNMEHCLPRALNRINKLS